MSKINLNDLLQNLPGSDNSHQFAIPKFADNVLKDQGQKISVVSKKKQLAIKRELGYEMTKQEMDKWVGIIKINREKQTLNFQSKQLRNLNVNFFPSQPISDLQKKIQSKLQVMNVQNQKTVLKQQQAILEKVDPEQAKRRLIEARKHRTAVFYQEQKRRRISKIKSKLYHKIKKRQKQRQEVQKIDSMNPHQKNEYIEKLLKQRIKERITLRHSTKSKHIQNLLRFNRNEKNSIQNTINEINDLRHKNLEKLNEDMMEEVSEEYDDQNFREQAMKDLEAEIQAIEKGENIGDNEGDDKLNDLKFIRNAKEKRQDKQKDEAYKLYRKLEKGKQLKEKDVNSDASQNDEDQDKMSEDDSQESENINAQRKVFGKKVVEDIEAKNPHVRDKAKQKGEKNIESQLKNYLLLGGDKEQNSQKNQILTKDINLENLKSKYQPDRVPIDLSSLIDQNKQIYQGERNEAILENIRDFQHEKMAQIEQEFNKQQAAINSKKTKGWGSWAGPGISQKRVDPQEELKKKLKMIEQIKRKRKDNSLAHVTINEVRNKQLSEYFVKELPHNFTNADQFDFMQNQAIGPEWNSFNHFKDNIKPKVITKAGQVITPVKLPRNLGGNTKKKY